MNSDVYTKMFGNNPVVVFRMYGDTKTRVIAGWQTILYEVKEVQRKEESDWQMVYLARKEGAPSASISWQFDLKGI